MKNKNEIRGLTIPTEVIKATGLGEMITLTAAEGIILLKSTEMTALQLIQTVTALDEMAVSLYNVLLSNFSKVEDDEDCAHCDGCSFCEEFMEDSVDVPAWAKEAAGICPDTKLCICVEENSERIILEPVEYENDITDIDEDTLIHLSDMGICLGELNESIMSDEVIYCE